MILEISVGPCSCSPSGLLGRYRRFEDFAPLSPWAFSGKRWACVVEAPTAIAGMVSARRTACQDPSILASSIDVVAELDLAIGKFKR